MDLERSESEELRKKVLKFLDDKEGSAILLKGEQGNGKARIVNDVLKINHLVPSIHQDGGFFRNVISVKLEVDELFQGDELTLNVWKNLIKDIEISYCDSLYKNESNLKKNDYIEIVKKVISDVGVDWFKLIPLFGGIPEVAFKSIKSFHANYSREKTSQKMEKQSLFTDTMADIFDQLKNYFNKIIQNIPVIIFIDNVQWADNTSLKFLCDLCKFIKTGSQPLLLILTYSDKELFGNRVSSRDNFKEEFIYLEKYNLLSIINVDNLDKIRIKDYLTYLNLPYKTDREFCNRIYELSRGNLFIINMLLSNLSGKSNITISSLESFPENLSQIIAEYLNDLSPDAHLLLKYCSIMGETFSIEIIEKLFSVSQSEMEKLIQELLDKELIISSTKKLGNLRKIYQFTHFLIRRYVYSSYDENLKLDKHVRISELLINNSNTPILNMYLHHWGVGRKIINESNDVIITKQDLHDEQMLNDAKEYLKQMKTLSEKFKSQFIFDEALNLFTKILYLSNLLNDSETFIEYSIIKSAAFKSMGNYNEALALIDNLLDKYSSLNSDILALLQLEIGDLNERKDKNQEALDFYHKAEKLYEKTNNENGLAKAFGKIGTIYFKNNDFETALAYQYKKIELCKKLELTFEEHNALNEIGNIYCETGELGKAENIHRENYNFYSNEDIIREKMISIGGLGIVYKEKKMYSDALKCFNEKLEFALKLFDKREEMKAYGNIANIYLETDEFIEALKNYDKVISIATALEDVSTQANALANMGFVYLEKMEFDKAKKPLLDAMDLSLKAGNKKNYAAILEEYQKYYDN